MTPTASTFDLALVWLIAGWSVVALGAAVLLWALFRDRSRGRRRCPKCWYDMSGAPSLKCPECGREAKNDRALFRTRRKWRWAVVAVVLVMMGLVGTRVPRAMEGSWFTDVPVVAMRPFLWMQRERARSLYDATPPIPTVVAASGTRARFGEEWTRLLIASELNRRLQKEGAGREIGLLQGVRDLGAEARPAMDGVRVWLRNDCQVAIAVAGTLSVEHSIDMTGDLIGVVRRSSVSHVRQLAALEAFRIGLGKGRLDPSLTPAALRDIGPDTVEQAVVLCVSDSKAQPVGQQFALAVLESKDPAIRCAAYGIYMRWLRFGAWAEPALDRAWSNPILENERTMVCCVARIADYPHAKWFPRLMVACEDASPDQRQQLLKQLSDHVLSDAYTEGQLAAWLADVDRQRPLVDGREREVWQWIADQCSRHFPAGEAGTAHFVRRVVPMDRRADAVRHIVYNAQDLTMARAVVSIVGPSLDAQGACEIAEQLLADEGIAWVHATTIGTLGVKFADHACMRPVILRALESNSQDVRMNACLAAAKLPTADPEAMARLEQLARTEVTRIARVARRALDQLSSRPVIADGEE